MGMKTKSYDELHDTLARSELWVELENASRQVRRCTLNRLFAQDALRFQRLSTGLEGQDGWLLDYSKQLVTPKIMRILQRFWEAQKVTQQITAMRAGQPINHTERRAVLHFALRHSGDQPVMTGGMDVMPQVRQTRERMLAFCDDVHAGRRLGVTGKRLQQVIHIGIGGSDLGPKMAVQALSACRVPGMRVDFVSNLDAAHLASALADADPERTLFVVASKTFTTQETLQNAESARAWLVAALGSSAVARHFVAVSANPALTQAFGIPEDCTFSFWDWVGGRFSVWSPIGISLALAVGSQNFRAFLAGAESMDRHFFETPVSQNLPATLALLDFWNSSFLHAETRAVLPYSHSLGLLPAYLQQLEMESNGKKVDRQGNKIDIPTCPVVWGEAGTNGQHAFYQLLHQGGRLIPAEFMAFIQPDFPMDGHHDKLLANCLAQSEALMKGKTLAEARREGLGARGDGQLDRYRVFPGNQPSTTLLMPALTPHTLGQLIALYEHKVFSLGALWNINAFDQWGVEYGKQVAQHLLPSLAGQLPPFSVSASTRGLLGAIRNHRSLQPCH